MLATSKLRPMSASASVAAIVTGVGTVTVIANLIPIAIRVLSVYKARSVEMAVIVRRGRFVHIHSGSVEDAENLINEVLRRKLESTSAEVDDRSVL